MPESESKPKLIELIGPGTGQGWKAVLRNGKPAVVHEIPVPPAEATAAVPRLQRLFEHRHPALSPVLAWGTDQNGVWVAVEPNEGTPLSSILARGPLTPPAAAALGAAVLSGVAALHEAGIAMGGFGATAVRVTNNGEVRLAGHPAAAVRAAPSQSDLRADVRSCGMAVCAAFGVDPAGAPAPANISPGLVVTMRSMASGAMGPSADRAQGALREMAAALLSPDREMSAQSELATRAGGREVPPITPFLPAGTVAPPATPTTAPTPPAQPAAPSPAAAPAAYIAPQRRDATSPPAPPPPVEAPPVEAPAAAPAQQAWTPLEAPAWKPGETVPAEPLGGGVAVVQTPPTAPPVPRAPISAPARKPSVARPPSRGGPSFERPPWLVPAAVAVVIVLLLGGLGVIVLANRGGGSVTGGVRPTPSANASTSPSRSSPSASPTTKGLLAVPTYGPASADGITKVQICTTASPCNIPGGSPETGPACELTSCKVEVAIYFSAVQKSVPVAYTMKFFDRCSGQTIDLPGTATTTPATGYIVAIPTDHLTVNIPGGAKSGAMVAAAQKPAVAYSAPLLVGADSC